MRRSIVSGVPQRLTLVTLGVADVVRSTAFYEQLGWVKSSASQEAITFFTMQGSALALFGREIACRGRRRFRDR